MERPYRSTETTYDLKMVSLVFFGTEVFQNWDNFPYAMWAWEILWLIASSVGLFQDTIDPRYLIFSLVGVGVESMKEGGVLVCCVLRYSVLVKLRNSPYRVASDCTLRRYSSTAVMVTPNNSVSSAYSIS